ncbi:metal ABC transporter permease [Stieleria varia]|uniref:Manganese transport system membrane protein MntB n=1 Tax=Stieleria varia TaxID=2528005 RepID=A0A5C5ZRB6_9BACT|nr:metal ABC transporter permease [Stieleria varia]TWT89341.1 Manganese transport system membrane protein MntB [Stieleria varia]
MIGRLVALTILTLIVLTQSLSAAEPVSGSLAESAIQWPTWSQWRRVLTFQDYNTRIVVFGVATLGAAAGLVGNFTLLRKRALMGDALSHATLPGIALAFVMATAMGMDGKSLVVLLLGATVSGLLGMAAILWIRSQTRLHEDAALGIVLSVFFGAGVALLGVSQQMSTGNAAGLESYIYGKTASMGAVDAKLIFAAATIVIVLGCLMFKEFKLLCFDDGFAGSRGFPVMLLDILLMSMVVLITIVGLQAVGLVLMIALLVIPAAAARFWTEEMSWMSVYATVIGLIGSVCGATLSAVFPRLPSGAMIVLVCSFFFFLSMLFGRSRGVVFRWLRRRRLNRRIDRQHLMRAMFELGESRQSRAKNVSGRKHPSVSIGQLLKRRSWSKRRLATAIEAAAEEKLLRQHGDSIRLTSAGMTEAARLTRQHRMWEMYLIAYAEIAPAQVDRDADDIEHVLEPEIIDQLEVLLEQERLRIPVPEDPHAGEHNESQTGATSNVSTDTEMSR